MGRKKLASPTIADEEMKSSHSIETDSNPTVAKFLINLPLLCSEEGMLLNITSTEPLVGNMNVTGVVGLVMLKRSSKSIENALNETTLVSAVHETREVVQKLILKGIPIDIMLVKAIGRSLDNFSTITVLHIENCCLTYESFEIVARFIKRTQTVKDLSFDRNPLPCQSYHTLLENNRTLQHLSLNMCKLYDSGAKLLAEQLAYENFSQELTTLNLNNNGISCDGAEALAGALRTNRKLVSLSLAANRIADRGSVSLATALGKFKLSHQEVISIRREVWDQLEVKKCKEIEMLKVLSLTKASSSRQSLLKGSNSLQRSSSASKKALSHRESASRKGSHRESVNTTKSKNHLRESLDKKKRRSVSKSSMEKAMQENNIDQHPFIQDATSEGGEIFCFGNVKLAHLNLAYNHVGREGVMAIYKAVDAQESNAFCNVKGTGLRKLLLQGNEIPDNCLQLLDEIAEMLSERGKPRSRCSI